MRGQQMRKLKNQVMTDVSPSRRMIMRNSGTRLGHLAILFALAVAMAGCGSGGNNDQGIAFTATGIFGTPITENDGEIICPVPTTTNVIVDVSGRLSLSSVLGFPISQCEGFLALENNLTQLAINVQRVDVSYEIPGGAIAIPENPVAVGYTVASASSTSETTSGQPNLVYAQLPQQMVPAQMMEFLRINRNLLPQTPYRMTATLVAVGQAQNGDQYRTNPVTYSFTVTD